MDTFEKYKKLLLEKEQELLDQQKMSAESEKPVSLDDPIGRITRIDAIQRQQQALYAKGRTANSLRQVREALRRVDIGTYGVCTKCKSAIEPDRTGGLWTLLSTKPCATVPPNSVFFLVYRH